jgi:hypothetical protein
LFSVLGVFVRRLSNCDRESALGDWKGKREGDVMVNFFVAIDVFFFQEKLIDRDQEKQTAVFELR